MSRTGNSHDHRIVGVYIDFLIVGLWSNWKFSWSSNCCSVFDPQTVCKYHEMNIFKWYLETIITNQDQVHFNINNAIKIFTMISDMAKKCFQRIASNSTCLMGRTGSGSGMYFSSSATSWSLTHGGAGGGSRMGGGGGMVAGPMAARSSLNTKFFLTFNISLFFANVSADENNNALPSQIMYVIFEPKSLVLFVVSLNYT